MSVSPYDWAEHEPGCRCVDCRKVIPLHKPKPAIPEHIKRQLAELKAEWRRQRLAEVQADREHTAKQEESQARPARALERKQQDEQERREQPPAEAQDG
jgi:hypothetical protein